MTTRPGIAAKTLDGASLSQHLHDSSAPRPRCHAMPGRRCRTRPETPGAACHIASSSHGPGVTVRFLALQARQRDCRRPLQVIKNSASAGHDSPQRRHACSGPSSVFKVIALFRPSAFRQAGSVGIQTVRMSFGSYWPNVSGMFRLAEISEFGHGRRWRNGPVANAMRLQCFCRAGF